MIISSQIKLGISLGETNGTETQVLIKNEPMLHRSDKAFAEKHGGPLTKLFLSALSYDWHDDEIIIDSRVNMLMPGMYPSIPGWHHDDVPREREDKQPNYISPSYKAEHCMCLFGDCSLTEFALGEHVVEIPKIGEKIYKVLNSKVEQDIKNGVLERFQPRDGRLLYFDWLTWHRATEATRKGFRFFIRATRKSKLPARNEIRVNANVYMPVINEGW